MTPTSPGYSPSAMIQPPYTCRPCPSHPSLTAGPPSVALAHLAVSYLQAFTQAAPSAGTLLSPHASFTWLTPAHPPTSMLRAPPPEAMMSPLGAPSVQVLLLPTPPPPAPWALSAWPHVCPLLTCRGHESRNGVTIGLQLPVPGWGTQ